MKTCEEGSDASPQDSLDRCSVARFTLNCENGDCFCEWSDDLRHRHLFLHDYPFFLQEIGNWIISVIDVPGYVAYG